MKKTIIAALSLIMLVGAVSSTHGYSTTPNLSDEVPENNSVIEMTYDEVSGSSGVTLAINATDSAGGDINVTFYNEGTNSAIGTNTTGGDNFTMFWDVDQLKEYKWYVKAKDNNTNTTISGTYYFEIQSPDSSAPSISFDSAPSGTILDRTPLVNGSTDEEAKVYYKIDGGEYNLVDSGDGDGSVWQTDFDFTTDSLNNGQHTITVKAEDRAGNTNTRTIDFKEADGSEINFQVNVDKSYPESGIPIDPDSAVFPQDSEVDFNFSLVGSGHNYDISNGYQDGICDFYGDDGWQLGDDYFCGSKVPSDAETGVEYDLTAKWTLRGETHQRVLDSNFPIEEPGNWYSTTMSHGGRVDGSVELNTDINGDQATEDGTTYTCTGNTVEVNNIQQVTARCSNGASTSNRPPVVSWLYRDGSKVTTNNNDMFNDGNCQIGSGITRQVIQGTGISHKDEGYLPNNCDLQWTLGGDSSFTVGTLSQPGNYDIYIDYVNAISNSPDYVCPQRTDNNNLCDQGSISGDESGWNSADYKEVTAVNPAGRVSSTYFSPNIVKSGKYIRRRDYSGDITGNIEFKNTGTGKMVINSLDLNCPSGVSCSTVSTMPLTVETGETVTITWTAEVNERTTGPIDVELTYDDAYGLSCSSSQTKTWDYYIDEDDPDTGEQVN